MNFEHILFDCIKHSPERTGKSAAAFIGVSSTSFGLWLRCSTSRRFPSVDYLPAIASLSGHDLREVIDAYIIARAEKPETKRAIEDLAA